MKRYRLVNYFFDFRRNNLDLDDTVNSIIKDFGENNIEQKLQNLKDLRKAPMLISSEENLLYGQIYKTFVCGNYYTAWVGACTLGERILNEFMFKLRAYYKTQAKDFFNTKEIKTIYNKQSWDDWGFMIKVLKRWGFIDNQDIWTCFKKLKKLRTESVHYNKSIFNNGREKALQAVNLIYEIIDYFFTALGFRPWFIEGASGINFVCKEYENNPFVQEFIIPHCLYVGYKHKCINLLEGQFEDFSDYPDIEISNEEYLLSFKKQELVMLDK